MDRRTDPSSKTQYQECSVRQAMSHPVVDRQGHVIGRIVDMFFECERGMVTCVVVEMKSQRHRIVPYSAMRVDRDGGGFILEVNPDVFDRSIPHAEQEASICVGSSGPLPNRRKSPGIT